MSNPLFEEMLANYSLSVAGFTYEGVASIRSDYFTYSHLGAQANADVLEGIINDEGLPIKEASVINWELSPAD